MFAKLLIRLSLLLLPFCLVVDAEPAVMTGGEGFYVLCYHNVQDNFGEGADRSTVSTTQLIQHFSWLKQNGYKVVSIEEILAARRGEGALPSKAILLTFDDGYKSFRTQVFPLLKAFNYPAVLALVGSWLDVPPGQRVPYDDHPYVREDFLGWDDIREMTASGLVEVASHGYDLHHGIPANPQGNLLPAAIVRRYSKDGYETEQDFRRRIQHDLRRNSDLLERELGKRPRVMVWPYGRYNETVIEVAKQEGMPVAMTLDDSTANNKSVGLDRIKRILVSYNPSVVELAASLRPVNPGPIRVMHIDLDYVYDPDPAQQEGNLSKLLDRVKEMGVNTVFLQAYADPDGDGAAAALYFPNRHLPMRADLFSRVAWQLFSRSGVKVFAWMPVLAFQLPDGHPDRMRVVRSARQGKGGYPRLSPFDTKARQVIKEIYEDLSSHAVFQGVLFHDDLTLSDFEDASPAALRHYVENWSLPAEIENIRADREVMQRWSQLKIDHLTRFTLELAGLVSRYQPNLLTARNLYARVVLEPGSQEWFAQSLQDFLANYTYTAVMAMPFMEGAAEPLPWLTQLVDAVGAHPGALRQSIFELQSVDWRTNSPISATLLAEQMRLLQTKGAIHFGYYPDNFFENKPDMATVRPFLSLRSFPFREPGK
ncbi:MAG: poly-beta-1,6-N-acetyl-D-glucosamine N-deacetylase PgaB [Thermodesulfobacteriota bacterium]